MAQQQNNKRKNLHDPHYIPVNEYEPPRKQTNIQAKKRCRICYEPSVDTGCTECQRCVHEKCLELRPIIPCVKAYLAPSSK